MRERERVCVGERERGCVCVRTRDPKNSLMRACVCVRAFDQGVEKLADAILCVTVCVCVRA